MLYMGFGAPSLPTPPGNSTCMSTSCPDGQQPLTVGGCTTECFELSASSGNAPEDIDTFGNSCLAVGQARRQACACKNRGNLSAEAIEMCCPINCNTGSSAGLRISEIAALAVNNCYDDRGTGHKNNFYGGYMARKVGRVMRYDPRVTKRQAKTSCYCCK